MSSHSLYKAWIQKQWTRDSVCSKCSEYDIHAVINDIIASEIINSRPLSQVTTDFLIGFQDFLTKWRIIPEKNGPRFESRSEFRKTSGSFYTPAVVARWIVRKTIALPIKRTNIIDPACGAGVFLKEAFIHLTQNTDWSPRTILESLHGIDISPESVEAARKVLLLEAILREGSAKQSFQDEIRSVLERNIICGNALTGNAFQQKKFDSMIGNPPYRKERYHKDRLDTLADLELVKKYKSPRMDFWFYFLHFGLDILAPGGQLGFILNASWLRSTGSQKLITRLKEETHVREIFLLGKIPVFQGVSCEHLILLAEKNKDESMTNDSSTTRIRTITKPHSWQTPLENYFHDDADSVVTHRKSASDLFHHHGINVRIVSPQLEKLSRYPTLDQFGTFCQGIVENPAQVGKGHFQKFRETLSSQKIAIGEGVFVIDEQQRQALGLSAEEEKLLKPYPRPEELVSGSPPKRWLIHATAKTWPELEMYPNLARHLARFRPIMEARRETRTNVRPWWQLHWPRQDDIWSKPKLVIPQMAAQPTFIPIQTTLCVPFCCNMFIPFPQYERHLEQFAELFASPLWREWFEVNAKHRGIGLDLTISCLKRVPVVLS